MQAHGRSLRYTTTSALASRAALHSRHCEKIVYAYAFFPCQVVGSKQRTATCLLAAVASALTAAVTSAPPICPEQDGLHQRRIQQESIKQHGLHGDRQCARCDGRRRRQPPSRIVALPSGHPVANPHHPHVHRGPDTWCLGHVEVSLHLHPTVRKHLHQRRSGASRLHHLQLGQRHWLLGGRAEHAARPQ